MAKYGVCLPRNTTAPTKAFILPKENQNFYRLGIDSYDEHLYMRDVLGCKQKKERSIITQIQGHLSTSSR